MSRASVLIVEDDPTWADIAADALGQAGYTVRAVPNAAAARAAADAERPDLAIVDIALDTEDGLVLCADLKERVPELPILVCSASQRRADRVLSLRLADAYVSKPCDLEELVARVEVLTRATPPAPAPPPPDVVRAGDLVVHRRRAEAVLGDRAVELTAAEHRLLMVVGEQAGRVVPRKEVVERVHGRADASSGRALDMLAARLRAKLAQLGDGAPVLRTVRGFGLQLVPPD